MRRIAFALSLSGCWLSHGSHATPDDPPDAPPDEVSEPEPEPEPEREPEREVRIAVLVDGSQSMAVSDPPSPVDLRTRVQDGLDALLDARLPGSSFLVAEAAGMVVVLTQCDDDGDGFLDRDCFTDDATEAHFAVLQLGDLGGLVESWAANLLDLDAVVRADVAQHPAPETAQWVLLFVTDEGEAVSDDIDAAAAVVSALRADLQELGAELTASAVVLDAPLAGAGTRVAGPLAEAGGGTVLRVAPGDAIDFSALVPGDDR